MSIRMFRTLAAIACALAIGATSALPTAAQARRAPKLVVLVVVDQMRGDYLEWYGANFTSGFRRLTKNGAWFTQAAYPYLNTVTCPGHSTIGTGTFPYRHGMILNNWFDRSTGKSPYCTDDPEATEISYNQLPPVQGDSAKRLMTPAIGEQILARGGRSVALSLKPRSAVTLTGHAATAVVWFDDRGGWTTSSVFTPSPVPFLKQFIESNPVTADVDKVWERSRRPRRTRARTTQAEGILTGARRFIRRHHGADAGFRAGSVRRRAIHGAWRRDDRRAQARARQTTDFLGGGSSSTASATVRTAVNEVQDALVRLDKTLGRLLDRLDASVGAGNYVLGLTADHGVAEIPEQIGKGGRVTNVSITAALRKVLDPALGAGTHIAASAHTDVYLSDAACAKLQEDLTLREAALSALRGVQGMAHAFWGADLATDAARHSPDPIRRAAALSYYPGRSGDLIAVPAEQWLLSSGVTTHGTLYAYAQRVPVILFGASVRAGRMRPAGQRPRRVRRWHRWQRSRLPPPTGALKEAVR